MKHIDWKKILPYAVAIVAFLAVALIYCAPIMNGKVLQAGDVNNWKGAAHEVQEFAKETGETSWWTNSMFGGMPTYQISGSLPSGKMRQVMENISHGGMVRDMAPAGIIFAYLVGFFLMLICFGLNPWWSIAGAVAMALSSYFMLIIPAGHITKAAGIAALAPIIGGVYAIFRKKYGLGIPLVVLYGIIGITLHPQMTYYVFMLIGVLICGELYIHIREKRWKDLGISLTILVLALLLVFGTKISWFSMNQEYLHETMRGSHSELTQAGSEQKQSGLDLDYATAWSYGIDETLTFLIPNYKGGASGYNLGKDSQLEQGLKKMGVPTHQAKQFCQGAPTYWGEKAFTSGPVYIGAVICFLFVLGLLVVNGPYKWSLLIATLFSVLLAWGRNFMPFTELFFDYFPMYNKFRAVESILVVAEITMPLLGFLGLKAISEGNLTWKRVRNSIFIAGGITGLICLIVALFSSSIDVTSSYDAQWKGQVGQQIYDAILDQRTSMIHSDAWRSLLFIILGTIVVFGYAYYRYNKPEKKNLSLYLGLILCGLIIADMWPVNRRFFNTDNFVKPKDSEAYFKMQPWEEEVLQDKSLDYRTLNLAANTFNDARTSYRLKSIGGYSAVKLRRFQDLIDAHISQEMNPLMQTIMRTNGFMTEDEYEGNSFPVINMLNTRYVVVPLQGGKSISVRNPYAMGNAWFVDEIQFVNTPDDESAALNVIDLHTTAVADKTFAQALDMTPFEASPLMAFDEEYIHLTKYAPNRLEYDFQAEHPKQVVFSEIYYPKGWHLYVDNEEYPIGRADYILRAAVIPAGKHNIHMEFVPEALALDVWCIVLIAAAIVLSFGAVCYSIYHKKQCK